MTLCILDMYDIVFFLYLAMSSSTTGPRVSQSRGKEPVAPGMGTHFSSPRKPRNKRKTQEIVEIPGQDRKRSRLLAELEALKVSEGSIPTNPLPLPVDTLGDSVDHFCLDASADAEQMVPENPPTPLKIDGRKRSTLPDTEAVRLYKHWKNLLPSLVDPLLSYQKSSFGQVILPPTNMTVGCQNTDCKPKSTTIMCLYSDREYLSYYLSYLVSFTSSADFRNLHFVTCACFPLPRLLVEHGLFPASPSQPRIAVSIDLLELYRALFERSCDAINALAAALHSFYTRRGFPIIDKNVSTSATLIYCVHQSDHKGEPIRDAFRRSLGTASQWYDCLRLRVEQQVEDAIVAASEQLQQTTVQRSELGVSIPLVDVEGPSPGHQGTISFVPVADNTNYRLSDKPSVPPPPSDLATLPTIRCSRLLQQRCPSCFSGVVFGQPFKKYVYIKFMLVVLIIGT
jgi:CxC1 like cysteine cluster associated with KDZ transposases